MYKMGMTLILFTLAWVMESNAMPNQACLYPLGEAVSRGFADVTEYLLQHQFPLVVPAPIMNVKISARNVPAETIK